MGPSLEIDIRVAPFHNRANKPQEELGGRSRKRTEANQQGPGWHYIICRNWMLHDKGKWLDHTS